MWERIALEVSEWVNAKHVALRRKSNDCLTRNQDIVFEWGDMSLRELLFR
jgi:hypothetical protein